MTNPLPRGATLWLPALSLLTGVALGAQAAAPRGAAVSDRTVAERVAALATPDDHDALATYYRAKAAEQDPIIPYYERLFAAYMKLEGKSYEPLRKQARLLLKSARLLKKHYELLAATHFRMALEARLD